ncbi:alpha/beta hydrolase [Janibacter alittae]|uniref:Alpha/beta hydrolase n=1 Tax=Janibacter alittae TaxID=3115209 RepID=A0ABZ2MKM9_9MICO
MTTSHESENLMAAIRQGRVRVRPHARAVALILHGGRAVEPRPRRSRDVSYLRMLPFAPAVWRASRGSVAPVLVHNRDGGWIAPTGSGLAQTRELVRRLADEHGLPVVLLGHSSGGWAALRCGDEEAVAGAVALAPWIGEEDPDEHLRQKVVRVVHGEADTVCSPQRSRDFVERLRAAGGDATYQGVSGGHALLERPRRWHALAAQAVVEVAARG